MNLKGRGLLNSSAFYAIKRFVHEQKKTQVTLDWKLPEGYETRVRVHNSGCRAKVPLVLKRQNIATWYCCGPTVYASAHIGHACTYVKFDIIRRILKNYFGIDSIFLLGVTDIDDKIINRSKQSDRDWKDLARHYEDEFFRDMASLNVLPPSYTCRVTDYMPQIIEFVGKVLEKDAAYVARDGSVYFDTRKYSSTARYGKLESIPPSLESHPDKKSDLDFALWKASKAGEPSWSSPWGEGRPGWHIECSAIASYIFGDTLDIHSGGIDLAFPHHENEEAQCCSYHEVDRWVNYWLHTGHLHLSDGAKMSKSLNNGITIRELLAKYSSDQFRMFCLLSNYHYGVEFSETIMNTSAAVLRKIEHFIGNCNDYVRGTLPRCDIDEPFLLKSLSKTKEKVEEDLANDFDTPKVIRELIELISIGNEMLHKAEKTTTTTTAASGATSIAAVSNYVATTVSKLGIDFANATSRGEFASSRQLENVLSSFVQFRSSVRTEALKKDKDKDLLRACDTAREDLLRSGVALKDHRGTTTWTFTEN